MTTPLDPEFREEWLAELDALRREAASMPEDEEDGLMQKGEAMYEAMSPEMRARLAQLGDAIVRKIQAPANQETVARLFRELGQSGTSQPKL